MKNVKTKIFTLALLVAVLSLSPFLLREMAKFFAIHGVQIANLNVGGLKYDEMNEKLQNYYGHILDKEITLTANGKKEKTSLRDLGLRFDSYKTTELAFNVSYGSNPLEHLANRTKSLVIPMEIKPEFTLNEKILKESVHKLFPEIKNASDANIVIGKDGFVSVKSHSDGLTANFKNLEDEIKNQAELLEVKNLKLETQKLTAKYTDADAFEDANIWNELINKEIKLYSEENNYEKILKVEPIWVSVKNKKVTFNEAEIEKSIKENIAPDFYISAQFAYIKEIIEGKKQAIVEGIAQNGQEINISETKNNIIKNIKGEIEDAEIILKTIEAEVINETNLNLGDLQLISVGRSNFKGSPSGRSFNINKGLTEKVNNVLLSPGEEYSFNSLLGPVTYNRGWKDSLAIFGGRDLRPVPGGGLCQVSTTVYRAALNAGLSITEQYNHSLYVGYYRAFGDGLDSTIFPGIKDLKFVNDTNNYLLIQAYTQGDDAYVNFYGTPDGRKVNLAGPFYQNKISEEYKEKIGNLRRSEIAWLQEIIYPDGTIREEKIVSKYNTNPY